MSKLGLGINITGPTANVPFATEFDATLKLARHAESLEYESIWAAEATGTDCIVPMSFIAAHTETIRIGTAVMQMAARTPAMAAQTAATLDKLSRGRFIMGLGASGPGVVEGWHSQAYGDPIKRTREYVEVVRRITCQRRPVTFDGEYYKLPYRGPGASGDAQPLRFGLRPSRERIPIYLAAMGPRNLALANEIADGTILQLYSPFRDDALFGDMRSKFGEAGTKVVVNVAVCHGNDKNECLDALRPYVAFWLGKMGAGGINFYKNFAQRIGFSEAEHVSAAFARGDIRGATAAVPRAMVDELCLCGSLDQMRDRLEAWRESVCTTMLLCGVPPKLMAPLAEYVGS